MKKKDNHTLFSAYMLLVVMMTVLTLVGVNPAKAQPSKWTGEQQFVVITDPGTSFVDGGGNLHTSGMIIMHNLIPEEDEPSVKGTSIMVFNTIQKPNGDGTAHGTVSIAAENGTGTWEGTFNARFISGNLSNGHANAQGTGDYAGQLIRWTFESKEGDGLNFSLAGFLLDPHGD